LTFRILKNLNLFIQEIKNSFLSFSRKKEIFYFLNFSLFLFSSQKEGIFILQTWL